MLLISKPSFAHIGDGLVEPPGPFIKMGNGEFHLDAHKVREALRPPNRTSETPLCSAQFCDDVIQSRNPDRFATGHTSLGIKGRSRRGLRENGAERRRLAYIDLGLPLPFSKSHVQQVSSVRRC
jgi:hypothetical protein